MQKIIVIKSIWFEKIDRIKSLQINWKYLELFLRRKKKQFFFETCSLFDRIWRSCYWIEFDIFRVFFSMILNNSLFQIAKSFYRLKMWLMICFCVKLFENCKTFAFFKNCRIADLRLIVNWNDFSMSICSICSKWRKSIFLTKIMFFRISNKAKAKFWTIIFNKNWWNENFDENRC